MPAKDYTLAVSGLGGIAFITKVSKTNPNLMLSDRKQLDNNICFQFIEEFVKKRLNDGCNTLEVKEPGGKLIYDVTFHTDKSIAKRLSMNILAKEILEQLSEFDPAADPDKAKETIRILADQVVKLTS